jgi:hypothetical protein
MFFELKHRRSRSTSSFLKLKLYQQMKILNIVFHECHTRVLIPSWFGSLGLIVVMGVCGIIRLHSVVSIFDKLVFLNMSFSGFGVLFSILHAAGNISRESDLLKVHLRNHSFKATKHFRKTVRAMKKFGLRCEPIRVLKHNAVGIILFGIQNYIVSILLAYPHCNVTQTCK